MKKIKKGFFLFSFSVYLSCIFLLCGLLFSLLYISYRHIFLLLHHNKNLQSIEKASWSIIRLLENAPNTYQDFNEIEKYMITWHQKNHDTGLFYDTQQKKLYCIKGTYNIDTKQISMHEKNLILEENLIEFSYQKNPFFITCTIKNEKITRTFIIQPRIGIHFTQGTV